MQPRFVVPLLLAFCLSRHLSAQTPVWSQFPSAPAGTTPRYDDLSFVNESTGWVARATGGIFKTTDGGRTFTTSRPSTVGGLTAHFRSINFASATRGWAGNLGPGSYDGSVNDTNVLYETFDGGTTWSVKPGFPETGMRGLCAIQVFDAQHIYGGGRVRGPAYFIKSSDGGTNWSVTNLTAAGVLGGIMDVYFKDLTNGFLVGMGTNAYNTSCTPPYYHGSIARTTNGGLSWEVVGGTALNCCYFWKMSWPSPNVGYVSLQQNGPMVNHIFYKTTDGGATWISNGIPFGVLGIPSFYWQGVGFMTETEGWAGGDSASGAGNFLHTLDGGATWIPAGSDATLRINRIRFLRPDYAVASGARVAVFRVPLSLTTQPTNQIVPVHSNVTFVVTAQGSTALAYQWRLNGTNVAGATTNALSIPDVLAKDAGDYDLVVGDVSGSITSDVAKLFVTGIASPPSITAQPESLGVPLGASATFTVSAIGSAPLDYQWRFNGTNLAGATATSFTRTNVQAADLGGYSVLVSNIAGSVTSHVAVLSLGFGDDFDGYVSPVTVTTTGITNGYKILFNAASGGLDFKAIFGYNYGNVSNPTTIPPAPHSIGGTTKGLYLGVNKDASGQLTAVNLYPTGQVASGNFALKFDMWLNWSNALTSTEHVMFGINHSGNITNRISLGTSDGLFFAVSADGGTPSGTAGFRDYSVLRGGGSGVAPILMTTANTTFGPTPPPGSQFDNLNAGFVAMFPARSIPAIGNTPAGSAGLQWVSVEVRQVNRLVTCLLNGTAMAQYTNIYAYTNGSIMIGYSDNFTSVGDANSFLILDNVRVESIVVAPVAINAPRVVGSNFVFDFATEAYESYTVQRAATVTAPAWLTQTNRMGTGGTMTVQVPLGAMPQYYRVSRP